MNSLGAYKVDRRKRNMIYIETLKAYSTVAIQKGCHSLFFPGGTRSRSGKIEKNLKKGLLNSVVDAQRIIYEKNDNEGPSKVFVVPITLNYHFVLEAPALINQYLKIKGQERYYVENDEYSSSYKILKFLFKFFTKGSDISVSVGQAMDVLGNHVDFEGHSLDSKGRRITTRDYFTKDGIIAYDQQRDDEYTKRLSKVIVEDYHRIQEVFASHLVAFTAFEILKKRYNKLDLYNLLRLPDEDIIIDYHEFREKFSILREIIFEWNRKGKIGMTERLKADIDEVIKLGIDNVGMYHAHRPLIFTKEKNITSDSLNTLYFYRNRLDGYGLEDYI
jgi:glycerol-3-phosphate O-acyltransferase